jgi:quercetin dioxygenase-like cupin family protein
VVSGDPATTGAPFVMRLRYRGAVRIPPHWHPADENITVLSGTFMVGMGERFDEMSATELQAGAYALMPKKMPHYAWTKGDTVVQVHGLGPFTINYVNPADDPGKTTGRK